MIDSATHVREPALLACGLVIALSLVLGGCNATHQPDQRRTHHTFIDGGAVRAGLVLPVAPLEDEVTASLVLAPPSAAGADPMTVPHGESGAFGWEYERNDRSLALRHPYSAWERVAVELEVHDAQRMINGRPRNFYQHSIHIRQFGSD